MSRKSITIEMAVNAALDVFIATRACITDINIYKSPEAAVVELRSQGVETSARTIASKYKERGITYDERLALWTKSTS